MSFLKGFVDSIKYHQAMEEREKERQMQLEERQTQRQFTLDRDEANRAFQREMYETRRKDVLQERGYKIRSEMDAIEADANKPIEPPITLASSEIMSPNKFSVKITSNCLGFKIICIAALSTNK